MIGLDAQKAEIEVGSPSSLFGEIYRGSHWDYYPVAFACKLPLAVWTAVLLAVATAVRQRGGWRATIEPLLYPALCVVVILGGMALLADINMGLRYVLPALPLLYILLGCAWRRMSRAGTIGAAVILVGLAIENISVAPRYLTFYNAAVGGPARGWRNLYETFDWGQGLKDLKRWMTERNVAGLSLAYFGRVDPAVYEISYAVVPAGQLKPYVGVSAFYLYGLWYMLPTPAGPTPRFRIPFYRELQDTTPDAVVGSTIFIYSRDAFLEAKRRFEVRTGKPAEYYF
jgi:hypothetical protein